MSTIHTLAADIASRIPDMAKDSPLNNQMLIEGILKDHFRNSQVIKCNGPVFTWVEILAGLVMAFLLASILSAWL